MSSSPPRRLLVAVSPRLLGDTLARALATATSFEVVVYTEDGVAAPGDANGAFDLAVVSGDLPQGVTVDIVLSLPDTPTGAGIGRVRSGLSERDIVVDDIGAIQRVIGEFGAGTLDVSC